MAHMISGPRKIADAIGARFSNAYSLTEIVLGAWVVGLAGNICSAWILSTLDAIRFGWIAGSLIWIVVLTFAVIIVRTSPSSERSDLRSAVTFTPFVILLTLTLFSSFYYSPANHDSLCYRIPRIFLWLQDGHVGYVPTSDMRINYMTHNWELSSLPVLQTLGVRFLPVVSIVSWVLLYLVGRQWAGAVGTSDGHKNWLGLFPAVSTFAILQAHSTVNDLFAATLLLISAWYAFAYEMSSRSSRVLLSGIALALACGTKPHYIVLALPWSLWYFLSHNAPWRRVSLKQLTLILPILLVISPLPAFVINHIETGSYKGISSDADFVGGNALLNMLFGSISFLWQSFQPPVNLMAGFWNAKLEGQPFLSSITDHVPRFGLDAHYLQIVDFASVGFCVMAVSCLGWIAAFRSKFLPQVLWIALCGLLGFLIAVSQVVPGTIGRSFMGYFFLLFPMAIAGLSAISVRITKAAISICALAALFSMIFDASRPLVTGSVLASLYDFLGLPSANANILEKYKSFRERAEAGASLFNQIPDGSNILIVSGGGDPLLGVWTQTSPNRVNLVPLDADPHWIEKESPNFLVVTATGQRTHNALLPNILNSYKLLKTDYYTVRLQEGNEKWQLFQIR